MMKIHTLVTLTSLSLLITGCQRMAPLENLSNIPIPQTTPVGLSTKRIQAAIIRGASHADWVCTPDRLGSSLICNRHVGNYHVDTEVTFDRYLFNIDYLGSANMDERNGYIYKMYNRWVRNLRDGILQELGTIAKESQN